jgi:AcrR family transcriptional regulator
MNAQMLLRTQEDAFLHDSVRWNGAMGSNGAKQIFSRVTQRERLLDGIAQTVARRGYADTSVANVLDVAGVSRRTFYELFVDKEDCFLAAYDAIVFTCTERVTTAYHAGHTWEDAIEQAYRTLLGTLAAEPDFAHLGVVDVLAAGPQALARRDGTLRRFARFLDFTRERTETSIAPPALVGEAIVGGIHELVYSRMVRGETAQLPELTPELLHYTFMLLGVSGVTG